MDPDINNIFEKFFSNVSVNVDASSVNDIYVNTNVSNVNAKTSVNASNKICIDCYKFLNFLAKNKLKYKYCKKCWKKHKINGNPPLCNNCGVIFCKKCLYCPTFCKVCIVCDTQASNAQASNGGLFTI